MTTERDEAVRVLEDILACTPNLRPGDESAIRYAIQHLTAQRGEVEADPEWTEKCPGLYFRTCATQQAEAQAVIPKAKDWLEQINGAASREWMDGWDACRVEYELFLATQQPEAQAVAWRARLHTFANKLERIGYTELANELDDILAHPTTPAVEPSSEGVRELVRRVASKIEALKLGESALRYHGRKVEANHIAHTIEIINDLAAALATGTVGSIVSSEPQPAKGGEEG